MARVLARSKDKLAPVTEPAPNGALANGGSKKPEEAPTVQQRVEAGKAARKRSPREEHSAWTPPAGRPDPIELLEAQAATRVAELIPIRYGRMLASPFAFYRGAAAIMASDLGSMPNTGIHVQLCGDAHVQNFGSFASPERQLVLDVNDFDETLPGPWEWDVKRLAASIEIAARGRGFDAKTRRSLVLAAMGEYRRAMREFAALGNLGLWYLMLDTAAVRARWGVALKPKESKALDADLSQAHSHDNQRAFEKLTHKVNGQLRIVAHPPLIVPIEDLSSAAYTAGFESEMRALIRRYGATLEPDRRRLLETYRYAHLARKVVGVGSVGTRTWIILLLGRDDQDPLFLQCKEAQDSVLEAYLGRSVHSNHGERVVEGQRFMQSASDIFLGWDRVPSGMDNKPHDYYVRQLWDWKVSVDVAALSPDELMVYSRVCAWTLARAHARSGDRMVLAAYLGKGKAMDEALASFAAVYADQNEQDYQALVAAAKSGRIKVETGV